ncbi:MAG TPA: hypothetical protein VE422_43445 [Terriglobia bacterium]|nr:hypothetical protein [Terriglobia bacterium]
MAAASRSTEPQSVAIDTFCFTHDTLSDANVASNEARDTFCFARDTLSEGATLRVRVAAISAQSYQSLVTRLERRLCRESIDVPRVRLPPKTAAPAHYVGSSSATRKFIRQLLSLHSIRSRNRKGYRQRGDHARH